MGFLAFLPTVLHPPAPRAVFHALATIRAPRACAGVRVSEPAILALDIVDVFEIHTAQVANLQPVCLACADLGAVLLMHVVLSHMQALISVIPVVIIIIVIIILVFVIILNIIFAVV
jgi:hypothetical protein